MLDVVVVYAICIRSNTTMVPGRPLAKTPITDQLRTRIIEREKMGERGEAKATEAWTRTHKEIHVTDQYYITSD